MITALAFFAFHVLQPARTAIARPARTPGVVCAARVVPAPRVDLGMARALERPIDTRMVAPSPCD